MDKKKSLIDILIELRKNAKEMPYDELKKRILPGEILLQEIFKCVDVPEDGVLAPLLILSIYTEEIMERDKLGSRIVNDKPVTSDSKGNEEDTRSSFGNVIICPWCGGEYIDKGEQSEEDIYECYICGKEYGLIISEIRKSFTYKLR